MKAKIDMSTKMFRFLLCVATGVLLPTWSARANVYATNIKLNGSLSSITSAGGSPVTISYILNQTATLGVTVSIWQGTSQIATLAGGTNVGLNSVVWGGTNSGGSNVTSGTYSIDITASALDVSGGTTNWTQISVDGANTAAVYPLGMDVDKNALSPYYGRVVVGCAADGTVYGVAQKDGLYKANADGSPADEGAFGYAGYTTNDSGNVGTNEMSYLGELYHSYDLPGIIRIGGDDRIYFIDQTAYGSVVACDILATTNQIVICEGMGNPNAVPYPLPPSPAYSDSVCSYSNNPEAGYLNFYGEGWGQFDVAGFETGHPAIYLCDTGDYPSAGVWMYHLKNGAADPADPTGTQAVETTNGAIIEVTGSGLMVDTNLDLFVGEDRFHAYDSYNRVFDFTNWNGGVLPPEDGIFAYSFPDVAPPKWMVGSGSFVLTSLVDTVINSRFDPTLVAVATDGGAPYTNAADTTTNYLGGISILNVSDGSLVVTNLDYVNNYTSAAFDAVGNLYGCSPTTNYWRAWSPPGPNTNTTVAVAQIIVSPPSFTITSIGVVSTGPGTATLTLYFTAPGNPPLFTLSLLESPTLNGLYAPVDDATITGGAGSYQATFSVSSTEFFKIELTP
jgi:hypothetical protein